MNYTYFVFAFYVFLLLCGTIWFYGRVMRADKKKDRSSYEKEHRLFTMYQNVEDMLDSFEAYAEEARTGIDERLRQVEALIESLRNEMESRFEPRQEESVKPAPEGRKEESAIKPEPEDRRQESVPASIPEPEIRGDIEKPQKDNTSDKPKLKTQELIQQYVEEGMNKEEIAKLLGISMREVSLIMEIKKINV